MTGAASAKNYSYNTKNPETMQRISALTQVFSRTDRIITGDPGIFVHARMQPQGAGKGAYDLAPGFSNGRTIYLNLFKFRDLGTPETLVRLLGLNYHELSHIMFTPFTNFAFTAKANASDQHREAMNVLEDQRIETLFTAIYPSAAKYFASMVVEFLVNNPNTWDSSFIVTHGRRFLPLAMREEFEARFKVQTPNVLRRFKSIIDEYRTLDLTNAANINRAIMLINDFAALLKQVQPDVPEHAQNGGFNDPNQTGGNPAPSDKEQRETSKEASERAKDNTDAQDKQEENGDDGSGFWDDDASDDDSDDEGDEDEDASGGGADAEDDTDDSGDGDSDDSGDGGEGDSADDGDSLDSGKSDGPGTSDSVGDEPGNGAGSQGSGEDVTGASDDELSEYLRDMQEAVLDTQSVQSDVENARNAMRDPASAGISLPPAPHTEGTVRPEAAVALNQVQREFARLHANVEPGWDFGSDEGRLNIQRVMQADVTGDYDDIYDKWDEGREQASGAEVVIAIDLSGSMDEHYDFRTGRNMPGNVVFACEAAWIVKRAVEELEADVSVIGFGTGNVNLFDRADKAPKTYVPQFAANQGGTNPRTAFEVAGRLLTASDRPNKLFVLLTDGDFDGEWDNYYADAFKTIPGERIIIGFDGIQSFDRDIAEAFNAAHVVSGPLDMVPVVRDAISRMLRRVGRNV